jgi:hypothetical protein
VRWALTTLALEPFIIQIYSFILYDLAAVGFHTSGKMQYFFIGLCDCHLGSPSGNSYGLGVTEELEQVAPFDSLSMIGSCVLSDALVVFCSSFPDSTLGSYF